MFAARNSVFPIADSKRLSRSHNATRKVVKKDLSPDPIGM